MMYANGWITDGAYGCAKKRIERTYADVRSLYSQLLQDGLLRYPVENFSRFNQDSKLVACSVALALYDAGISYAKESKQDIGMVLTSPCGALSSDLEYFQDYVAGGRTLGRANFFIYTLPSSPLAEAAIHFGLEGPLAYLRYAQEPEAGLLSQAEAMVKAKAARVMLAVIAGPAEVRCIVIPGDGR